MLIPTIYRWNFTKFKMSSVFRFKQFEVEQSGTAMKINTDGVLLASIATHAKPIRILDIGTGTGVIALMLAQRFAEANIDAVEIDAFSAQTAGLNFDNAPFAERLAIYHSDILNFSPDDRYDLIVSNPPYFVNDLKNELLQKQIARHADEDFFGDLLRNVSNLLTERGLFWVILPVKTADWVIEQSVLHQLYPFRIISVHSDEEKPVIRKILCLKLGFTAVLEEHFYIYAARNTYTTAYKELLKDFFLAF